jgi:hypothetical protein
MLYTIEREAWLQSHATGYSIHIIKRGSHTALRSGDEVIDGLIIRTYHARAADMARFYRMTGGYMDIRSDKQVSWPIYYRVLLTKRRHDS